MPPLVAVAKVLVRRCSEETAAKVGSTQVNGLLGAGTLGYSWSVLKILKMTYLELLGCEVGVTGICLVV